MATMNREEQDILKTHARPTVLIIGGGINGIGVFRDLALQGVDVLLVERGDFCSGASAASSHMVHGGIRYLENGEFRLVREAVRERNRLLQNAPHLVKPLPTVIPIFRWFSGLLNAPLKFLNLRDRPAERGALVIKIGLMLYDAYTGGESVVPRHRFYLRREALRRWPRLNPRIIAAARYYDAAMPSPERLALEVLLDGLSAGSHARAVNYLAATARDGDAILLQPTNPANATTITIKPTIVINAAGPWIDFANRDLGAQTRFIGGTKGSHLVLDHPELRAALNDHEFFFENDDGRIVLIYPYGDKVLVGTSDIPIDDPDQARCTEEEIDYFLGMIHRVFPGMDVRREHIVFQFSGVRPLAYQDAATPGQITRDHQIKVLEPAESGLPWPVLSLVGGKWTTFRAFSEQVTDEVLRRLGRTRQISTRDRTIGGGRDYPQDVDAWLDALHRETALPRDRLRALFVRYGTRAADFARFCAQGDDRPLSHHPGYSRREVAFIARHEFVRHLDDLVLRRTLIAYQGELTAPLLEELAEVVGDALGWDAETRQGERERTRRILAERHGLSLSSEGLL